VIHWDHEMRRARASTRLSALPGRTRAGFAAAALHHAFDRVRSSAAWSAAQPPLVVVLERAFAAAAGSALDVAGVRADLGVHAPDEDSDAIPGQADLVDGMLRLLSLREEPAASAALDVASYAYQAVAEVSIGHPSGGEETFRHAERSSPACVEEIAAQLGILAEIERATAGPG
jgi:hypothetical protein